MARFILQPYKIRADNFVPLKDGDDQELTWDELAERLAPAGTVEGLMTLRRLEPGAFVGLARHPANGQVGNFLLLNQDRSGRITWLLKKDPTFPERLVEVFRVKVAEWDHQFQDM